MVSGRADGGLRGEPCTSTEPKRVCGSVEYRADEDHRSLFADDRPRGLFGHDRQLLSPNGSGHPHDLRGSHARWSATDDDRGHPRHQDDHGRQDAVVHDTVSLNGKTTEDTLDWYAQDRDGNVWYFGEATKKLEDGTADTTGSFESGVNSALPGIIMPGHPKVGDQYRQEYAKGVAEDTGEVLNLTGSETTALTGPVSDLLVTKDSDLLDPTSPPENKYYLRGIGLIMTTEPGARDEAVKGEKF
jgi:hypothetical protein